jgi:type I restriction enzyme S subunit
MCREDDVLIARYGASLGKILRGLPGAYNVAIMKTIPNETVLLKDYLYIFLCSDTFQYFILNISSRAAQAGFNKTDLKSVDIPLPPLPVQQQIADVLDHASALIEKRKAQIEKLNLLVKSRFVEMFDGGEGNSAELREICSIITDGTHQPPKFIDNGIPFLLVSNIVDNEINYNTKRYISREEYDVLIKRTPLEIGDILLTTVGSYGNPAIVRTEQEFCFQRHIAYMKPKREIANSVYLHAALLSDAVKNQIEEKVKGIAQKTLNLSELKTIRIFLPPMDAQTRFADFVQQADKSKFEMQRGLDQLELLYKSLMQKCFKGENF